MYDRERLTDPDVLRHSVLDFRQMSTFVQNPLIIERAEGVHYWDINGKHYYDGISGIFVVAVGHGNRRVIDAMKTQMERLCFAAPLHATNGPAVAFADLLARIAPGDLNTVKLLSSGSEATETAMKLARQYWKQAGKPTKYKFITRYWGRVPPRVRSPPVRPTRVPSNHGLCASPPSCYRCPYARHTRNRRVLCRFSDGLRSRGPDGRRGDGQPIPTPAASSFPPSTCGSCATSATRCATHL